MTFLLRCPHNTGQLTQEEKLIDLRSGVARLEQYMGRFETRAAESQLDPELPSIPKQMLVSFFINS